MEAITGIFASRTTAELARAKLQSHGFSEDNLILLTPGASRDELDAVPTEDAEQPGMGKAIGGVTGGALGLAAGAALASISLPGVGTIVALGLGAGSLGAAAGAAGGDALENLLSRGLPKDEIFFYEDALRAGRTLVIALSNDENQITLSRDIMESSGAESLDAAREKWWIGLGDAENTEYDAPGETSQPSKNIYRRGFEVAQEPELRGKTLQEAEDILRDRFPEMFAEEAFRHGYTRGHVYASKFAKVST